MKKSAILTRLASGEFDMQYTTPEFSDGGRLYRIRYPLTQPLS